MLCSWGCSRMNGNSKEWNAAGEEIAKREWALTNGMRWPNVPSVPEIVMGEGARIAAKTSVGEIVIEAGRDYERIYTWDGATRLAKLAPRRKRWYGSYGIYSPGEVSWSSNGGITRGVLNEGVLWFYTTEEAIRWLSLTSPAMKWVFNDDGLVVGWRKTMQRKQLDVEVWQIMIDGRKPNRLLGSKNDAINVFVR